MGLGAYPTLTLAMARDRALEMRRIVADGIDPIDRRRAILADGRVENASTLTFDAAALKYIAAHEAGWRARVTERNGELASGSCQPDNRLTAGAEHRTRGWCSRFWSQSGRQDRDGSPGARSDRRRARLGQGPWLSHGGKSRPLAWPSRPSPAGQEQGQTRRASRALPYVEIGGLVKELRASRRSRRPLWSF